MSLSLTLSLTLTLPLTLTLLKVNMVNAGLGCTDGPYSAEASTPMAIVLISLPKSMPWLPTSIDPC